MVSGAARDDTYGADTDNAALATATLRIILRFISATTSSHFFYTRKPKYRGSASATQGR
jgi:hypothetical protein